MSRDQLTYWGVILNSTMCPLYIGNCCSNSWINFPGSIQDVRIYNYALSEKEVANIARAEYIHYTFNDENDKIPNYFLNNLPVSDMNYTVENLDNGRYKITCINPITGSAPHYFHLWDGAKPQLAV